MIKLIDFSNQIRLQKKNIIRNIDRILTHGKFIMGPEIYEIENKLKKFVDTKYCSTVSSGTEALLISLMAIGLKKGDEVIVPGFTYIAPVEVVVRMGAKPILIDVNQEDANIDTSLIEKKITKKTKSIIFVNLFGNVCDILKLKKLKNKYPSIIFIEDAAQSFGSKYKNYKSCNTLDISCTSFFPAKPLGCYGDGGAIFTNKLDIHKKVVSIREHGQSEKYNHSSIGVGGRFDTLQAAILLEKLKYFKKEILMRKRKFLYYSKMIEIINVSLKENKQIRIIKSQSNQSCYASFNLVLPSDSRNKLIKYLNSKKINSAIYYPRTIVDNAPYKKFGSNKSLKKSNFLKKNILALPFDPYIKKKHIKFICLQIKNFYKKN